MKISDKLKNLLFCLNAASMGVPQKRERVFFIGFKNELKFPKLKLEFNEKPILFGEISENSNENNLTEKYLQYWHNAKQGEPVGLFKTYKKLSMNEVSFTLIAGNPHYHPLQVRELVKNEYCKIGTYPLDYNFNGIEPKYLIGMSVPPVVMAQISLKIKE